MKKHLHKKTIFTILVILGFLSISSDSISAGKTSERKLARKARKNYSKGNYETAISYYNQLVDIDSSNFDYNFETGITWYSIDNQKIKCIPYFERALKFAGEEQAAEVYYYLGKCYHLNSRYDNAISVYQKFLDLIAKNGTVLPKSEETALIEELNHGIEQCNNAKALSNQPKKTININGEEKYFTISLLSKEINSVWDDYSQVITGNDSTMYFTSRRKNGPKAKVDYWDGKFFEDIYVSKLNGATWSEAKAIDGALNTDQHDAPDYISSDGKKLYLYRSTKKGTVFISELGTDGTWSEPVAMNEKSEINSSYWETSLNITLNNNVLYIVSNREEGYGGRDIYKSEKQSDGNWGPLVNLGPEINTKYDEDAPFLSADGKILYFSSNGHNSIGGFDIFRSEFDGSKWSSPLNMGYPLNTPSDDVYFLFNNQKDRGYFSSSRIQNGYSDLNIYTIDFECPKAQIASVYLNIRGKGEVALINAENGNLIATLKAEDKLQQVQLPVEIPLTISFIENGKKYVHVGVKIPQPCVGEDFIMDINISENKISDETLITDVLVRNAFFDIQSASGKPIDVTDVKFYKNYLDTFQVDHHPGYSELKVSERRIINPLTTTTVTTVPVEFKNVLFDFDKSNIRDEFKADLDKLAEYLLKNKEYKLELNGHTDALGSGEYNLALSKRRANAIYRYLISKGVSKSRIRLNFYGKDKPATENETEQGRQLNRRVEIALVKS